MKALFDSSVFVAAFLQSHPSHQPSLNWLSKVRSGAISLVISGHTLAEIYAVITRLPPPFTVAPSIAWRLIEANILPYATIRSLSHAGYVRVLKRAARENLRGGILYDALIADVASRERVDLLVTLNQRHFQRVWPECADRVVSPTERNPPGAN